MTRIETRVLIVGAGPVGLITGLLLDRLGVDFLIVERREGLHQAPQAHVISSRTLEICRGVGIDPVAVYAAGPALADIRTVRWVDRLVGRDLGVFTMGSAPEEAMRMLKQSSSPTANLSQDRFEAILFERLFATAGRDAVRFEHAWEGYSTTNGQHLSRVHTPDGPLEVASHYLIGADGAGSRVRKAADIDMVGPDNLQTFMNIHFSANLREPLAGREGLLYWIMDKDVEGTFIAHDIERNWIFMKTIDPSEPLDPIDEGKFAALLREAIGADVPVTINSMNAWRMTAQIASAFRRDRLFLVGDAAHRFPPTCGIGMNTGFQDAHNLAWKVAMVEAGGDPRLLDTFEPERKPVAEVNSEQSVTNAMRMMEVAFLLDVDGDQRITLADLDAVLADANRLAAVQTAVDAQAAHFNMSGLDLGVCYTGAGVIDDGPPPASEDPVSKYVPSTTPGARLPHAMLLRDGAPLSTLDLVALDRFLVFAHHDAPDTLEAAIEELAERGAPLGMRRVGPGADIVPADDRFAALFPTEEVLLVRPDGHIAARFESGRATAELARALNVLLPAP
ncbi:MAG: hypothetical protein F4X36_21955 [Gammaproteobacteria bacterium]|nr:hypothetical protein [Gammaproteobacteria bacterium]